MTLADAKDGQTVEVVDLLDEKVLVEGLRWGIINGSKIKVEKNISDGPVIVSKKHVEMAIGRELARKVIVKAVG